MTDEVLCKALRQGSLSKDDYRYEAADRIEALTAERDEYWKSFVHWRKEADALTEQLEQLVATNEAEAYAEELEVMNKNQEAMIRQADDRGDALETKLARAVDVLSECLERNALLEARLAEAVEALRGFMSKVDTACLVERDHPQVEFADAWRAAYAIMAEIELVSKEGEQP